MKKSVSSFFILNLLAIALQANSLQAQTNIQALSKNDSIFKSVKLKVDKAKLALKNKRLNMSDKSSIIRETENSLKNLQICKNVNERKKLDNSIKSLVSAIDVEIKNLTKEMKYSKQTIPDLEKQKNKLKERLAKLKVFDQRDTAITKKIQAQIQRFDKEITRHNTRNIFVNTKQEIQNILQS
jgi:chromosome segregation ATPase